MKFHPPFRRGIALVIVLVLLVLMLGLILAFFSGVTTQRGFSRTAADAASTQQLADSAVNIVMSQIVDATGTSAGLSKDNGTTLAWASQPGMIRTYDDSGTPQNFYKLYSSGSMIVPGSGFSITTDDPNNIVNGGWNSAANAGLYTDLNAPVLVADPSGSITVPTTNGNTTSNGTYTAVYPIIDPFAENTLTSGTSNGVSGFSISSRPGYAGGNVAASSLSGTADPTATTPGSGTTANPAPMPAQWLYVLSQGQIVAPDPNASSNGVLKFTGSNALVSATNPIVGRIAFWADDDTCKVNINTASEGVYWDTPRVFSLEDCGQFNSNNLNATNTVPGMAICQPVQQEYQRYPGHPATTSLSAIFGNLVLTSGSQVLPVPYPWQPWTAGDIGSSALASSVSPFNQYYAISPRVAPGGSNAGTSLTGTDPYSGTISESGTSALIPSQNRLYASVDELMFTGSATTVSGTTARITNPSTAGGSASTTPTVITKQVLEKTRFFLTANSNAPEVTLFNTPRVSMWPVWDPGQIMASGSIPISSGSTARTAFDNLAAFCNTVGGKDYYFTRANSRSDTYDFTGTVMDPATGVTRNQDLYQYLQALTGRNIPGFGGNFLNKFTTSSISDRDQILTLMYDYIRCINMADSTETASGGSYPFTPLFQVQVPLTDPRLSGTDPYATDQDINNNPADGTGGLFPRGAGEVIPIKIASSSVASGTTMGVGRCLTVSEADLLFYATATQNGTATAGQTNAFSAVFLLQFASPMQGLSPMRSSLKYSVTGLSQYSVKVPSTTGSSQPLGLPAGGTNYIELSDIQTGLGFGIGGVEGPAEGLCALGGSTNYSTGALPYDANVKKLTVPGGATFGNYPFFATAPIKFTASVSDKTFMLSGSGTDVVVTLAPQDAGGTVTVQTIHLQFPNGKFMIPTVAQVSGTSFNARLAFANVGDTNNTAGALSGTSAATQANLPMSAFVQGNAITGVGDTLIGVQPAGTAVPGNSWTATIDPTGGDYRMIAPLPNVKNTYFRPHLNYGSSNVQYAHGMMNSQGNPYESGTAAKIPPGTGFVDLGLVGSLVNPVNYYGFNSHSNGPAIQNPYVPSFAGTAVKRAVASGAGAGDWDTGVGNTPDGAYMNKPDEGDTRLWAHSNTWSNSIATVLRYPYQLGNSETSAQPPGQAYFSPNKQVPSSLMFGSIPTGVQRFQPWQSLLFNPRPDDQQHPGLGTPLTGPPFTTPPDYLIADLFWMPVVQPYAISQPFSTAGKINLNYQILPFDYINRKTGLYAVMKATKFLAIPLTDGTSYKPVAGQTAQWEGFNGSTPLINPNRRQTIDIGATLQACDTKFANSDIYKSPTEICGINLIPTSLGLSGTIPSGQTAQSIMATFWQGYALTGNNVRDKPYVDIYPRLTTKSNTFTVHIWVQSLRQVRANASAVEFVDPNATGSGSKDSVVSEYRGSTTIERYIDPNDPRLSNVDFATNSSQSIDPYYKFRVVGVKRFSP